MELAGLSPNDAKRVLERCQLPEGARTGPCTAPLSRIRRLLGEAASLHHGTLSIALGQSAPEGTYETAELLVRTAPSLARGLHALARYAALINPVGRFEIRERKRQLEVHYFVPGSSDALGPHLNEYTIVYVLHALNRVASEPLPITSVFFAHDEPTDRAALEAHFGCPVLFGKSTCGFTLPSEATTRPLRTADPIVFGYLEKQAEAKLEALGRRSYVAVLTEVIESQVGFRAADLPRVAKAMGATSRTVQRRLEEEGISFREVIDVARRRHAEAMQASGMTPASIADALGFADVRSFRRALARWNDDDGNEVGEPA